MIRHALLGLIGCFAVSNLACGDEMFVMRRPDAGVNRDAGFTGSLPFVVGQTFTYEGRLTARGTGATDDKSALYTLTLTLTAVRDGGADSPSELEFTATGMNTFNRAWTEPEDFSTWVGRLGPSLQSDGVGTMTVTQNISEVPDYPSRTNPKQLPNAASGFFVDLRNIDQLRADFVTAHDGEMPTVADPDNNGGRWTFAFTEQDPQIITYEVPQRSVSLSFDTQGVLLSLSETVGDPMMPIYATNQLELQR